MPETDNFCFSTSVGTLSCKDKLIRFCGNFYLILWKKLHFSLRKTRWRRGCGLPRPLFASPVGAFLRMLLGKARFLGQFPRASVSSRPLEAFPATGACHAQSASSTDQHSAVHSHLARRSEVPIIYTSSARGRRGIYDHLTHILYIGTYCRPTMVGGFMAKKTILIVDDDVFVRMTYKHCFEDAGYTVFLAENGQEATTFLESQVIDAMLLDLFMPEKDGIETLLEVKRRFPNVPVIVISGGAVRGRFDLLGAAVKLGAHAMVRKPIPPPELMQIIERSTSAHH